ncbi:flagellar filament capping protein FliD [Rickettsiaceae bacterium]|nr:flagellar filament capping protein FliD [Rickettsiaceae bacterium]
MGIASAVRNGMNNDHIMTSITKFSEKAVEKQEEVRNKIQDKIEIQQSQVGEIGKLQELLTKLKTASSVLTNPLEIGFDKKSTSIMTQEAANPDDYIKNIRVDDNALSGDTKISIEQTASPAKCIIGATIVPDLGFAKTGDLGLDGTISITVNGNQRDVVIATGQELSEIIKNINSEFITNGDEFEAFPLDGGNDTAFIEIKAKNTGTDQTMVFANGGVDMDKKDINGLDAIIHIDAIELIQTSNKFINPVPGLSFELTGKVNTQNNDNLNYGQLNYNTISVREDHSAVKQMILDFGTALNELSYFVAQNTKSSRSVENAKYADPLKPLESYDDESAILRKSSLMTEAKNLLDKFTIKKIGATGDVQSIYDIGMNVKPETKDGVTYDLLFFEDEEKFQKLFGENFNAVKDFFVSNAKITPTVGNKGYVQYIPGEFDPPVTHLSVIGKDLTASVDYANGANGIEVSSFKMRVPNQHEAYVIGNITYSASINRYNVSFEGTILEGITFSVDASDAVDGSTEDFTINYSPGMSNLIQQDSRDMLADNGLTGTTISEVSIVEDRISKLETELERALKELEKIQQKNIELMHSFHSKDTQYAIELATIDMLLGDNDKR